MSDKKKRKKTKGKENEKEKEAEAPTDRQQRRIKLPPFSGDQDEVKIFVGKVRAKLHLGEPEKEVLADLIDAVQGEPAYYVLRNYKSSTVRELCAGLEKLCAPPFSETQILQQICDVRQEEKGRR